MVIFKPAMASEVTLYIITQFAMYIFNFVVDLFDNILFLNVDDNIQHRLVTESWYILPQ